MNLEHARALELLIASDHGAFCTVHDERGVDAVPAVFAVVDDHLGIPVDRVKPKSSLRLQRQRNLEADPRATLLVEYWDHEDWSQLWWVRANLRWIAHPDVGVVDQLEAELRARYPQFRTTTTPEAVDPVLAGAAGDAPIVSVLTFRITAITGWSGAPILATPARVASLE